MKIPNNYISKDQHVEVSFTSCSHVYFVEQEKEFTLSMAEGRILIALLECKEEFISVEKIMSFAWPDTQRKKSTLVVALSHIRTAMNCAGYLIENNRELGYRLVSKPTPNANELSFNRFKQYASKYLT